MAQTNNITTERDKIKNQFARGKVEQGIKSLCFFCDTYCDSESDKITATNFSGQFYMYRKDYRARIIPITDWQVTVSNIIVGCLEHLNYVYEDLLDFYEDN